MRSGHSLSNPHLHSKWGYPLHQGYWYLIPFLVIRGMGRVGKLKYEFSGVATPAKPHAHPKKPVITANTPPALATASRPVNAAAVNVQNVVNKHVNIEKNAHVDFHVNSHIINVNIVHPHKNSPLALAN